MNGKTGKELSEISRTMLPILKRAGIKRAGIFGSFASGRQTKKSDVDVLIEPPDGFDLFKMGGLYMELKSALKREIDLVTYRGINSGILKRAMQKEVRVI